MEYVFSEWAGQGCIVLEQGELEKLSPLYEKDPFYAHGILGSKESYAAQSALHILGINAIESYASKMSKENPNKLSAQLDSIRRDCSKRTSSLRNYTIRAFGPFAYSKEADSELNRLQEAEDGNIIRLFESLDCENLERICLVLSGYSSD